MLRVWSDILTSGDVREVTLLSLLDLSAAFDCVDHGILLQRLEVVFDLAGTALGWIRSFLTDRTHGCPTVDACRRRSVSCSACRKGRCSAHCCMCFIQLSWSRSSIHMYADDCQVYLSTSVEDVPLTRGGATVLKVGGTNSASEASRKIFLTPPPLFG